MSASATAAEQKFWDYPDPGCTERVGVFLASTVAGVAFGLLGDGWSAIEHWEVMSGDRVVSALVLSPLAVTFGGGAIVERGPLQLLWLTGGMLFWPGFAWLAWLALWKKVPLVWAANMVWCAQGYFQVCHRFDAIMSV